MKYLHFFLNEELSHNTNVTLENIYQEKIDQVTIFLEKNRKQKHLNIPLLESEQYLNTKVYAPDTLEYTISLSENKIYTEAQLQYNEKYGIKRKLVGTSFLNYALHREHSSKILITFPGFCDIGGDLQYPITNLKGIERVNKILFQDAYFQNGSYMLCDENGNLLDELIVKTIKKILLEWKINEADILFFGTSKGGSIALRIGSYFPTATIISIAPQIEIESLFADTYIYGNYHKNLIGKAFLDYQIDTTSDEMKKRIKMNNQKCLIWTGKKDFYANNNSELSKISNNIQVFNYNLGHNALIKESQNEYTQMIKKELGILEKYREIDLNRYNGEHYIHFDVNYTNIKKGEKPEIIVVANGQYLYRVYPPFDNEGTEGKFYNCVLPPNIKNYKILTTLAENELEVRLTDDRIYTQSEKKRDKEASVVEEKMDNSVLYFSETKRKTPEKLIITFPGFFYHYKNLQYQISLLKSIKNEKCNILSFQDKYFLEGTYMLVDDFGNELHHDIVSLINKKKEEYQLEEKDLIFFGASKGGTIALSFINDFIDSKFIAVVPQINLDNYRQYRPHLNDTLFQYYNWNNIDYCQLSNSDISLLNSGMENRDIHIISGLNDYVSHNDRFVTNINNTSLHIITIDLAHNLITDFSKIIWEDLITEFEIIQTEFELEEPRTLYFSEFKVMEKMNCIQTEEYQDILSLVEIIDFNTKNIVLSTPIAKLKTNNIVNTFINADIPDYISNYDEYISTGVYYFRIKVYNKAEKRVFVGIVKDKTGKTYCYDSKNKTFYLEGEK